MTSPPLPSPSSLLPAQHSGGFVTASALLQDLQLHEPVPPPQGVATENTSAQDPAVLDPALYTKTGRLRKPRKKAGDTADTATKPAPKSRTRKTASAPDVTATTKDEASPAPKRGRKTKTATEDAEKPVPKRGRKKAVDADPSTDLVKKQRAPPKPRKTKAAATQATTHTSDTILPGDAPDHHIAHQGVVAETESVEASHLDAAPKRRRDWTPPPEAGLPPSFQRSNDVSPVDDLRANNTITEDLPLDRGSPRDHNEHLNAPPAAVDFTDLMGDFGYQQNSVVPSVPTLSRTPSDQPTTKRKRLDPVKVTAAKEPLKRKKAAEPKPKAPKKPRAPKKKPVTITALATAAYRVQVPEASVEQSKNISEFFAHADHVDSALNEQNTTITPKSTKRPNADDKPAPKRKRSKKVQITVPEISVKLDSPEAARENMKNQQWLFGSSSQLAGAESPTELRDLQQALKESEEMVSSQHAAATRATSYARVPSAPHGTSLSIGQATRVLWMSAARDFEDSTFASDEGTDAVAEETAVDSFQLIDTVLPVPKPAPKERSTREAVVPTEFVEISSSDKPVDDGASLDSGYVDIDEIVDSLDTETTLVDGKSPPTDTDVLPPTPLENARKVVVLDASPESKRVQRSALGSLDPNTSIPNMTTSVGSKPVPVNAFSTKTGIAKGVSLVQSPGKRSPGRPRIHPQKPVSSSPLKKGRPRKIGPSPEPKSKGRGRPRIFGPSPEPSTEPKRGRGRPRRSQSPSRPYPSSDYLDIDDIDDPENIPITSPPRRPPGSPVQPLELDGPAPAAPRTAKQIQAEWSTISITLFPRITSTVKSAPPSTDPKTPSWHEKMLLYDPIVLEDLTAWLNTQGVRLEIQRPKIAKGKKGKAKVDETEEEKEVETEVLREALQPWMVQKWCEEHSVCCLWKEGLRGGVRQRY